MTSSSQKVPVWLDCDPGHDDAFAILIAAYHPAIELLGISTVHGNSSIEHTTENAGSLLTAIGKSEVPCYIGAGLGLTRPAVHAPDIHGESGLDGTSLLPRPLVPAIRDVPAIDAIAKALLATPPNTSWLIATGTLTNAALLFIKYPNVAHHIKGLSIMGGAVGDSFTAAPLGRVGDTLRFGNWTPYGEFNVVVDPEAADLLFKNPVLAPKTVLIPLDVTHQVLATAEVQELILHGVKGKGSSGEPSTLRVMLIELLNYFAETYATVFEITAGPPLHDPLAVVAVLDGIAGYEIPFYDFKDGHTDRRERFSVSVVTEGTHEQAVKGETQTGRTIVKLLEEGTEGVKIPRTLDVPQFWKVLEECLEMADEKNRLDKLAV